MRFTPSPTAVVRLVDDKGNVVRELQMNRAERHKRGIRNGRKRQKSSQDK